MNANNLVSVIIPNYNGAEHISECLDSVLTQTHKDIEIIVVDNESADNSVEIIKTKYPNVRLIENGWNAGWGIACNAGMEIALGSYYLMMNNDAYMAPTCAEEMLKAINFKVDYGSCASKILLGHEGKVIEVAGLEVFADGFSIGRGRLQPKDKYNELEEVFCANDCCCLFKKKMFDEIGLYDEDFFLYADETDIGWKAQLYGWKCIYNPKAIAYHDHSRAAGSYSSMKGYLTERNRLFIMFKYFPWSSILEGYLYSVLRYLSQVYYSWHDKGALGKYRKEYSLWQGFLLLFKAHRDAYRKLPKMLKKRNEIFKSKKLTNTEFLDLLRQYGVSIRVIAQYE